MNLRRRALAFDVGLATLLMIFAVGEAFGAPSDNVRAGVAEALQAGSVAFRRRAPLVAGTVFLAGALVEIAPPDAPTGSAGVVAILILLYSIGRYPVWSRGQMARPALGAGLAALVLSESAGSSLADWISDLVLIVLTSAGAYFVGAGVRARAEQKRQFELSSELQAQAWASRNREVVEEERRRIARELHDAVGHALAGIAVSAGAARSQPGSPAEVEEALDLILTATQQASADMRRLVGLLRTESDTNDLTPQPTLASLDDLIAGVKEAGVQLDFDVAGEPVTSGRSLELVVYRLVQEGLTNAMRHAPGSAVTVRLAWHRDRVDVAVTTQSGEAAKTTTTGHGLTGLRERVVLHGGTFAAGPQPEGGFRLEASLPLS